MDGLLQGNSFVSSEELLSTTTSTSTSTSIPSLFTTLLADAAAGGDLFAGGVSGATSAGILDTLQSIAVGITAVLFFLAGLTLLMANIIIPAAANELEKECKELAPELWDDYQRKLEPGQTIAQRPELMQELGAKLQPLLDAKIAQIAQQQGKTVEELMNEDVPIRIVRSEDRQPQQQEQLLPPGAVDDDDDEDSWSNTPTVDLSAITDQIQVPGKNRKDDDKKNLKNDG